MSSSIMSDAENVGLHDWHRKYLTLFQHEPLLSHVRAEKKQELERRWTKVKKLGQGGSGEVFEGINRTNGRKEAIKFVHVPANNMGEFLRETNIAREIAQAYPEHLLPIHDIHYLEFKEDPYSTVFFVSFPLADKGSLETNMSSLWKLSAEEFFGYVFGLFCALEVLHRSGIVHNDLKPDNILVFPKHDVKVADFGLMYSD